MEKTVNIGILGFGTVGTGVARILLEQGELLTNRTGLKFNLKAIADINWDRDRGLDLRGVKKSKDANELIDDPETDIIVETIGGIEPAFTFISKSLKNGKGVVTANKKLLALRGHELYKIAHEMKKDLLFEASVGGGIPIIKSLKEGLIANRFKSVYGIVNGTSNFILTKMHNEGLNFKEALKMAQDLGFAEADPTLDISGGDASHKIAIIGSIVTSAFVNHEEVYVEGIEKITKLDVEFAKNFGYTVKLLAILRQLEGGIDIRVHPTLIPNSHLLASVSNEMNAIFVEGDFVGNTLFYGPGAGERPTASAVVSDIVDLAKSIKLQKDRVKDGNLLDPDVHAEVIPIDRIENRFYLRFYTYDAPGILSKISGILGDMAISIASVIQLETLEEGKYVPLVLLTHKAPEKAVNQALVEIGKLPFVRDDYLKMRLF